MEQQSWFERNKVLLLGLLSAIVMALYDLVLKDGPSDTKLLIYSALIAAGSYLANNLRGQWASVVGLMAQTLITISTMEQTGLPISWAQIGLQALAGFLAIVAPPPKSRGYEHAPAIEKAKETGEVASPNPLVKTTT